MEEECIIIIYFTNMFVNLVGIVKLWDIKMENKTTIKILVGIIIILLLVGGGLLLNKQFKKQYEKGVNDGYNIVVNIILQDLQTSGYTQINTINGTIILVPST